MANWVSKTFLDKAAGTLPQIRIDDPTTEIRVEVTGTTLSTAKSSTDGFNDSVETITVPAPVVVGTANLYILSPANTVWGTALELTFAGASTKIIVTKLT